MESALCFQELLDLEDNPGMLNYPGVTTITFFPDADYPESLKWIKHRVREILDANPWLAGHLVRDKAKHQNLLLAYPQNTSETDVAAVLCDELAPLREITSKMPYTKLQQIVTKTEAFVAPSFQLIGKDTRVSKFTLVEGKQGEVVLIVSISHGIADGFTYYEIMNMLSVKSKVKNMSCVRKHEFGHLCEALTDKAILRELESPAYILNALYSLLSCPTPAVGAWFVDEEKIKHEKTQASARHQDHGGSFYISTNDIITSAFGKATKADLLFMTINLRDRVENITTQDAGNYESAISYTPLSYALPERIRQSLAHGPPFTGTGCFPGLSQLEKLRMQPAIITNWIFACFKADLQLANKNGKMIVPMQLHMPIGFPVVPFPIAIVFRPCPNKVAILCFGTPKCINREHLVASGIPLGKCVSDMFEN